MEISCVSFHYIYNVFLSTITKGCWDVFTLLRLTSCCRSQDSKYAAWHLLENKQKKPSIICFQLHILSKWKSKTGSANNGCFLKYTLSVSHTYQENIVKWAKLTD